MHFSIGSSAARSSIEFLLEPFGVTTGSVKSQNAYYCIQYLSLVVRRESMSLPLSIRGSQLVAVAPFQYRKICVASYVYTFQVFDEKIEPREPRLNVKYLQAFNDHRNRQLVMVVFVQFEQIDFNLLSIVQYG